MIVPECVASAVDSGIKELCKILGWRLKGGDKESQFSEMFDVLGGAVVDVEGGNVSLEELLATHMPEEGGNGARDAVALANAAWREDETGIAGVSACSTSAIARGFKRF